MTKRTKTLLALFVSILSSFAVAGIMYLPPNPITIVAVSWLVILGTLPLLYSMFPW